MSEHTSCPCTKTRQQAKRWSTQPVILSNGNREVVRVQKGWVNRWAPGTWVYPVSNRAWLASSLCLYCCEHRGRKVSLAERNSLISRVLSVTPPGPNWHQMTLRPLTSPSCHNHRLTRSRAHCQGEVTPYVSVKSLLVLFQLLLSSPLNSFTPSYSAISLFCSFFYWSKQILFHAYPVTFSLLLVGQHPGNTQKYCTKDLHLHKHMNTPTFIPSALFPRLLQ